MVEAGAATGTALLRWIPLLPLVAALAHGAALGLLRREMSRPLVIAISCGAPIAAFVVTCAAFAQLLGLPDGGVLVDPVYAWVGAGRIAADMAFVFDPLTAVMCLVVTGVGSLIHVYSIGYMGDDHRDDGECRGAQNVQEIHPCDHVDPRRDHRRGVDQGTDRRRAGHRVRQPDIERDLRRFAGRPQKQ